MRRDLSRCPHGTRLICTARHTENHPCARPADLPGLLRPRRTRRLERLGRRTLAPHHDRPRPAPLRPLERAARRQAAGLLRQGRRVPAPRRRPLPRPAPPRPRRPHRPRRRTPATSRDHRRRPRRARRRAPSPPPRSGRRTTPTRRTPGPSTGAPQLDIRPVALASATGDDHHRGRRRLPGQVRHQVHRTHRPPAHRPDDRRDRRVLQRPRHPPRPAHRLRLPTRHPPRRLPTSEQQRHDWHDTFGRLRRWTHMLGFGGHFATKSRRYSTTHKQLRAARRELAAHHTAPTGATATRARRWVDTDDDTTLDRLRPSPSPASAGTPPPTPNSPPSAAARAREYAAPSSRGTHHRMTDPPTDRTHERKAA